MADWRTDDDPRRGPAPGPASPTKTKPAADTPAPSAATGSGPAVPTPTLPRGGGAIRGIGEKFSANPVTGTAGLQIPIAVSPGRAGFQPDLSLGYDSGAGNGPFGHGFQLSVPHITRKTDKGLPTYDDAGGSDVFLLSGAEDLVPRRLEQHGGQLGGQIGGEIERFDDGADLVERYVPRVEGGFARIEKREHKATGVVYWQATTRDNVTSTYGRTAAARIAHPAQPHFVFTWLLEETRDDRGNVCVYHYKAEDLASVPQTACEQPRLAGDAPIVNRYLKRIRYGNTVPFDATPGLDSALFELVFDHGEHDADTPTVDEARPWPCRQDPFSVYRAGFEIRTYRLCRRALMFHRMAELGATPCLVRSTDLTYAENPTLTQLVAATHTGYVRDPDTLTYTRKSYPPVEFGYALPQIHTAIQVLDPASTADLPEGVRGPYQWVDLDGEGLPGVLSQHGDALYYKHNRGGGELTPARVLLRQPSLVQLGSGGQQITDLDGDGRKELAIFTTPTAGYFDRTDGGFEPFRPFPAQLLIDWSDPNLRHIDLNGDGFDDVLIARADRITWYPSLAKGGFGPGITFTNPASDDRGPAVVFADATQTLFVADMSGDGLGDLVRIENGSVCYWPNLGHGRFGARIQMGGDTRFDYPERFDPRRIRLADVDGSGTTDILYLHPDGVRIYTNQAGNSFARPIELPCFPDASDLSSITAIDLLGTGTGCLVWSSALPGQAFRSFRYIDLLGGQKPYLLTSYRNNLGLETRLEYAPSTRFYLADAAAGRPWVTRLHFPVHVLVRVETHDAISRHRFVSTYAYHHGYFDGVEREFRGFGMVEQWDTESFSRFSGMGLLPPPANASDHELHLPPVHTRTWFHTGAWAAADRIAHQYAHEYYAGDPQAALLPDTQLPGGLTPDDEREACRALKGQILRQETYADDGSPLAPHPYLVSERSYAVRCLQPIAGRAHGVFFVHPQQAIEYHYERNPRDPRITHAFTLEVDDVGTVRRSAAVGYPRRAAHVLFDEQNQLAITLSEVDVLHHAPQAAPGWYRLAVPIATRSYQLTGVAVAPDAPIPLDALLAAANRAAALPYEATPDGSLQKRLLSEARSVYSRDDLSGPLPFGQVESLALPWQSFAKAFTPALLADVFQGRVTDDILLEGGYQQLPGDDAWWVPSGRQIPSPEAFYLPVTFLDPFGNATHIAYDPYRLVVTQATDPVQNVVSAVYDHRVLAPVEVTDPNGNRSQARFDTLGMVVATAVMGKVGSSDGDTLDDPTTTFDYDLDRFRRSGKPGVAHARAREQHGAANTRWQESYSYADGSGHEVMKKVQAAPGLAPQRDASGAFLRGPDGKLVMAHTKPRWIGSGRTVFDNKGNPVKQYEPFFSSTFEYEDEPELVEWGVTPILRYDAIGRLIRTDLPNGTFSKIVFEPWQETRFDPNDTVLESAWYQDKKGLDPTKDPKGRAARQTALHDQTPLTSYLDPLGREMRSVAHNRGRDGNGVVQESFPTRLSKLDIRGNVLAVTDARSNTVLRHEFDLVGRTLHRVSMDSGERWTLPDIGGATTYQWDSRDQRVRYAYDALHRPVEEWLSVGGATETLFLSKHWGEFAPAAASHNLRGQLWKSYDPAGLFEAVEHDFSGKLIESRRQFTTKYAHTIAWPVANPDILLDPETFRIRARYDALGRPMQLYSPDTPSIPASEIALGYDESGQLSQMSARLRGTPATTSFVDGIHYNEKGQRLAIRYSNGLTTQYEYEPDTFRLSRVTTTRAAGFVLQDLHYVYDPVGNIISQTDGAQQAIYFSGAVAKPGGSYEYDALYRLTRALGREQIGQNAPTGEWDVERSGQILPGDGQAMQPYEERYEYDLVGNILNLIHNASSGGRFLNRWTRSYTYETATNRLVTTQTGNTIVSYTHNPHGSIQTMPHLQQMDWDPAERMRHIRQGTTDAYYSYDDTGLRIRKVVDKQGGLREIRLYLGAFEIFRRYENGKLVLERETQHIMDGQTRVALVDTRTVGDDDLPAQLIRYQLSNHLGSAVIEADHLGAVITYEEYHPFGTTSWQAGRLVAEVSLKRYRYTGLERDEESGFGYHDARYYAPWLGRWTASDPAGLVDGPNLYVYGNDNPIRLKDPSGTSSETSVNKILEHSRDALALNKQSLELQASIEAAELELKQAKLNYHKYSKMVEAGRDVAAYEPKAEALLRQAQQKLSDLDLSLRVDRKQLAALQSKIAKRYQNLIDAETKLEMAGTEVGAMSEKTHDALEVARRSRAVLTRAEARVLFAGKAATNAIQDIAVLGNIKPPSGGLGGPPPPPPAAPPPGSPPPPPEPPTTPDLGKSSESAPGETPADPAAPPEVPPEAPPPGGSKIGGAFRLANVLYLGYLFVSRGPKGVSEAVEDPVTPLILLGQSLATWSAKTLGAGAAKSIEASKPGCAETDSCPNHFMGHR